MRFTLTLTAVAIAAAILMAAPAGAQTGSSTSSVTVQVTGLRHAIQWHRAKTWHYQDRAGVARTPTRHAERRTASVAFLRWINRLWTRRMVRARHLSQSGLASTNDWQTAVRIVQRTWPGTASWLLTTSDGEGGRGGFVMNTQGSGAGGWLQYMPSTFDSHLRHALAYAAQYHLPTIPASARSWHSPLGQAFAGGWGCHHNPSAWSRPSC